MNLRVEVLKTWNALKPKIVILTGEEKDLICERHTYQSIYWLSKEKPTHLLDEKGKNFDTQHNPETLLAQSILKKLRRYD